MYLVYKTLCRQDLYLHGGTNGCHNLIRSLLGVHHPIEHGLKFFESLICMGKEGFTFTKLMQ